MSSRSALHTSSITFSTCFDVYQKQEAPDQFSTHLLLLSAHISPRTKSKMTPDRRSHIFCLAGTFRGDGTSRLASNAAGLHASWIQTCLHAWSPGGLHRGFFFLILHAGSLARWKGPDYQTSGTRIPQACSAHLQATIYQTCKVCSKTELKLLPHVPSHCVQNLLMIINQCKVC
jgi:hypothetical protein